MRIFNTYILSALGMTTLLSCEKLVAVDEPIDTITTVSMFSSDDIAKSAMAGLYTRMINEEDGARRMRSFSTGNTTFLSAFSADELIPSGLPDLAISQLISNKLLAGGVIITDDIWNSAYKIIYDANGIIEGVAASTSSKLTVPVRKKMTAEARFVRAFSYFYLTNFYGDLPLVLTIDFNSTKKLAKTPKADIYKQIIDDLLAAKNDLPPMNTNQAGERIYPGKWAATALLARVYLYSGDYEKAFKNASEVIGNLSDYKLESDLNTVFLKGSKETIWQLKQNTTDNFLGNATAEGYLFHPYILPQSGQSGVAYVLSNQLLNAFETNDQRKLHWVGRLENNITTPGPTVYFPQKYKTGSTNMAVGGIASEYYVMLRLAEQYLIRAEAAANGAAAISVAIDDLNEIRYRAGLGDLPDDLTQPEILAAIEQERRIEMFAEWGHRWFDLKRSGKAGDVLSQITSKQPWLGDYQLLYPIPQADIQANSNLRQNSDY